MTAVLVVGTAVKEVEEARAARAAISGMATAATAAASQGEVPLVEVSSVATKVAAMVVAELVEGTLVVAMQGVVAEGWATRPPSEGMARPRYR